MPASAPGALVIAGTIYGLERNFSLRLTAQSDLLIGQIKNNQNSRSSAVSPRGAGQTSSEPSLNDVERSGRMSSEDDGAAKLALCARR
jgi:hypothetical protein